MIIKRLKLENYRGHKNTEITFDENLTIIIGTNGSGKSSILDGISICLSWIVARIKNQRGQGLHIRPDELYNNEKSGALAAEFDCIDRLVVPNKSKKGAAKLTSVVLDDLNHYTLAIREEIERTEQKTSIPVFVHYGVRRAVLDIPLRIKKEHIFDLFETYNDSLNGDASFRTFFEWFRNQEDIENENFRAYSNLSETEKDQSFQPDRELSAVKRALEIFMPEYTDIRVNRHPLQMVVQKNGLKLRIDQLSDGEKIYIALVGDLCRKLILANPVLEDPLKGNGIVLIDELDLHLHPKWQSDIAPRLTQVFPNIQFIVTTHSPLVVTNVETKCLRVLNEDDGNVKVVESAMGHGLPLSVIVKDIMELEHELPRKIEELISDIYKALGENNQAECDKLYNDLRTLSPQQPELVRIRKLMELKSRRCKA